MFTGRIELWAKGINAIYSKPIYGNGFGYMSSSIKTLNDIGIHNSYFEILGDFGLLAGLIIIISLIFILNLKNITGLSIFVALLTGHGLIYTVPFLILITLNYSNNNYNE